MKDNKALIGRSALIATTLIWGTSFVVFKSALEDITPLWVLAIRFGGAALIMLLAAIPKLKELDKNYIKGGAIMGLCLAAAYTLQTYGLVYTTPGKNAFLTATYCILVPFLCWLLFKKKPDRYNVSAAVICLVGMGFVCLNDDLSVNLGDMLTVSCGLFFGLHIIATSHYVECRNVLLLTMLQFAVAGALCLVFAMLFEPRPANIPGSSWVSIAYLTVVCTGVCFFLQTVGQKYTPPSAVAVIMTLESVFGTALSIIMGQENITVKIAFGFCLIFVAIFISETKLEFLRKK
ncbi:MAG: DMT family transporter [Oscillospiraceae bacterium]|nr:DMT family transporter [Oscillospiraceae bacterium]